MARTPSKKKSRSGSSQAGDETRQRLIAAGIKVFGRYGYEAATTRMLAKAAGVNLAAIPYHFGGKEGLYHAVVKSVGENIFAPFSKALSGIMAGIRSEKVPPDALMAKFERVIRGFVRILICSDLARQAAPIILREQVHPTAAFEQLYETHLRFIHEVVTALVARLKGQTPDSEEAILCAHAIIGQIIVFRLLRETARRRLAWETFDDERTAKVCDVIVANIHRILSFECGEGSI